MAEGKVKSFMAYGQTLKWPTRKGSYKMVKSTKKRPILIFGTAGYSTSDYALKVTKGKRIKNYKMGKKIKVY